MTSRYARRSISRQQLTPALGLGTTARRRDVGVRRRSLLVERAGEDAVERLELDELGR